MNYIDPANFGTTRTAKTSRITGPDKDNHQVLGLLAALGY